MKLPPTSVFRLFSVFVDWTLPRLIGRPPGPPFLLPLHTLLLFCLCSFHGLDIRSGFPRRGVPHSLASPPEPLHPAVWKFTPISPLFGIPLSLFPVLLLMFPKNWPHPPRFFPPASEFLPVVPPSELAVGGNFFDPFLPRRTVYPHPYAHFPHVTNHRCDRDRLPAWCRMVYSYVDSILSAPVLSTFFSCLKCTFSPVQVYLQKLLPPRGSVSPGFPPPVSFSLDFWSM